MIPLQALLLLTDLLAASLYLWLASSGWRNPAEDAAMPVLGEPYAWAICLPVLAFLLVFNVSWGLFVVKRKHLTDISVFAIGALASAVAVFIDFYHH